MNGKTALRFAVCLSLLALILPAVSAVTIAPTKAGVYYYTGESFEKNFGESKLSANAAPGKIKSGYMMFTDSDSFHAKFGVLKVAEKAEVKPLPAGPAEIALPDGKPADEKPAVVKAAEEGPAVVKAAEEAPANGTAVPEIVVVPVKADALPAEEKPAENATDLGIKIAAPPAPAEAEDLLTGEEVAGETKDSAKANDSSPSGAAVSEGSIPFQVAVIGLLIVVIVIMLVVLLVRKEPGGKKAGKKEKKEKPKAKSNGSSDWEEGSFFREAKEKKDKNGSNGRNDKKEVKPFLLKIKDEA